MTLSIPSYHQEVGWAKDLSACLVKHMGGDEKTDQICVHDVRKNYWILFLFLSDSYIYP